jgi:hypothetical protein
MNYREEVNMAGARHDEGREEGQLMRELEEQFHPVFESSPCGVYLYFDDNLKICNERLAGMFGMSVAEWEKSGSFLNAFVYPRNQKIVPSNFLHHIAQLTHPVTSRFPAWRRDVMTFPVEKDMISTVWYRMPESYPFFVHEER